MKQIADVVEEINKSQLTKYHRGKSWEHCYVFFRNHEKFHGDEKLLDFAALNLGFFLASWGMLRGSSFLLQKDYKFYVPVVKTLTNSKYDKLWNINFLNKPKEQDIDLLFQLRDDLEKKINENNTADGDNKRHELNLIITKIIMATMGCIPAYDRYFKNGLKKRIKKGVSFNKNSFKSLLDLVNEDNELKKLCRKVCLIQGTNIKYPPMKLIDLHFWLLGNQIKT